MKPLMNQNGFTYILALTVVVIMGIMLGMIGQSWKAITQREQEEEMVFRGDQIAEIVYQRLLCKNSLIPPKDNNFFWPVASPNGNILDDLVIGKEDSCKGITRKIRIRPSAAIDPMTGEQWKIVNPPTDATRFAGVMSSSAKEPFRKNFNSIYDSALLNDKKQYSEWQFTWELKNK